MSAGALPQRVGTIVPGGDSRQGSVSVAVSGTEHALNPSARAVWELCDGTRDLADICFCLEHRFRIDGETLRQQVQSAVSAMLDAGLLTDTAQDPGRRLIDLTELRFLVINCEDDPLRRQFMAKQLDHLGLEYEFVPGVRCSVPAVGMTVSHLKALQQPGLEPPFAVLEDDCQLAWDLPQKISVPVDTDALYLGVSRYGIEDPGEFSWGEAGNTWYNRLDDASLRVFNMLGAHGIVYLSDDFHQKARKCLLDALTVSDWCWPPDVALAMLHASHLVVTPVTPVCHQAAPLGGNAGPTTSTLSTVGAGVDVCTQINDMKVVTVEQRPFYLFLDIFVHWRRDRITAVAPAYGPDIDWSAHGMNLDEVVLTFEGGQVTADCIRYRPDSWEPSVVLDFKSQALAEHIAANPVIEIGIEAGPHRKTFRLCTEPPRRFECAMSLIIRDQNRWVRYYLDYYLYCMHADHIYVYDNGTRDGQALRRILAPYVERGLVTLLPWAYPWRNKVDNKQIGQPPQQVHTLNRFGASTWIGFFDTDEFLRIPDRSIPELLRQFDPGEVGGVSFGLRWFMYQGDLEFDQIENPLLTCFHSRPDPLGRKRQKLFVSPRKVRFMRFHWIQEGQREVAVADDDVFFHHYCLRPQRFREGLEATDVVRDDYMRRFTGVLNALSASRPAAVRVPVFGRPRRAADWIEHVDRCLDLAARGKSMLTREVLDIHGMCGTRTRHFYSNLCRFGGCRLMEIGSWRGASLCSAIHANPVVAVSIDNWSEFNGPKDAFLANVATFGDIENVTHLDADCFELDASRLGPFDVFLYDGPHREADHYRALERYHATLEDTGIIIIDDWNREKVRRGTRRALADLELPVAHEWEVGFNPGGSPHEPDGDGWWHGMLVLLIDRTRPAGAGRG